ncbi:hypothetical protein I307_05681 [Cryptococcus deuterogattii 99/473]|uniref:Enoyl reductase (ER) domain-containing protein n=1 Tax=Cryptococcus deuterogattii Ram5 TaxID=1296110 RepID=A0A0D0T707_9TREE|nr:hypothetical protein I309_05907 [Cryptococcus deuterogattii LA55]KIR41682.1 hypothetical protein I313_02818 [Cryptococcus deuterogattii Ram5]KIR91506.1 hypothetical protein I304_04982 [Cryptococcus deuterogattii CBS 10090]KIY54921.1 hypothetical protein I307_05681 [Cryptococcus deuterogattii 99/473]
MPAITASSKFGGWAGIDEKAAQGGMKYVEFEPKPWDEDDYCGICASDTHILSGDWGPLSKEKPTFCGHEVAGKVIKVGSEVKHLKVGDSVCAKTTWTLTGFGPTPFLRGNGKGYEPKGGFVNVWRGPGKFAIPIPDGLDLAAAAPMLCGGITTYSPLERFKAGSERVKKVGVIGVGGLGHFGIMFAKAMGAEVTAISRTDDKKEDAIKLGASHFIAMNEGTKGHESSLDLILCTINPNKLDVSPYMALLRPFGNLVLLGVVPEPLSIPGANFIYGGKVVSGSGCGSPAEISRMFQLAVDHNLKAWIQKYKFDDINQAIQDFEAGKPRFRFVLVNEENGGKM